MKNGNPEYENAVAKLKLGYEIEIAARKMTAATSGKTLTGSGATELDELLKGKIPRGKSLVYYIQPGIEGEFFGLQMMHNIIKNGKIGVFVASSTSPEIVKSQLKDAGWDCKLFKNRFFFVDAYSTLIAVPSNEKFVVSNPENIHDFSTSMKNLLRKLPASIILVSSLSTIMDFCGETETIEAVRYWNKLATLYGHVIVYNFTAWPYSMETLNQIQKDLFNGVISISGAAEHIASGRHLRILKSDWKISQDAAVITKN